MGGSAGGEGVVVGMRPMLMPLLDLVPLMKIGLLSGVAGCAGAGNRGAGGVGTEPVGVTPEVMPVKNGALVPLMNTGLLSGDVVGGDVFGCCVVV
jgi:hypothetical protein